MNTSHERVLCFPRQLLDEIVRFQGFKPDDGKIVDAILTSGQVTFIERIKAESDTSHKQLIPYVIMEHDGRLLHYVRGKESGEERLRSLGSVGIGGHISVSDHDLFTGETKEVFWKGLRREVIEEVEVETDFTQLIAGLINDDSNPVGRVHLGVLVVWKLKEARVWKKERAITSLEFLTLDELYARRDNLETWSQIVVDNFSKLEM